MPARANTPRDLLFGLFALHNGLIDQSALVLGFHTWTRGEGRAMAEILVDQGAIDSDQRALLEALAALHLKKHGGDPEKSLAAIQVGHSTRDRLAKLDDPDLVASLATVGGAIGPEDDPYATVSRPISSSTSGDQRFRVLRPHARGGLGEVFVALDAELNREVALKEILDRHDHPANRTKFLIEAEITGGLEHPGIVPVYGLGHHEDGRPYYAMRFIRGDNLKQAIQQFHDDQGLQANPGARSMALRMLLRRFVDVCNAIEYAHSRGVLHRDIKPGNVIVGRHGETLVVDWGLAKAVGRTDPESNPGERTLIPASASGSAETLPGHAIGTPAYMSPEQAAGDLDRLGPRSDVYSLGATLYSLLTGRSPFSGDLGAILQDVQNGRFARPRSVDPSIDPALEALCLKAMARSIEDRYPSPKALAEDLDRWSADEPVEAYREPITRRARRWARRHRSTVTAAAASVLVALIGLAGVLAVQSQANFVLQGKNEALTQALKRENEAIIQLRAAKEEVEYRNALLEAAKDRETKANADLKAANSLVEGRYNLALEAVHSFVDTINHDELLKEEKFRPLRHEFLRSAANFYVKLGTLLKGRSDRLSLESLATAYHELAELEREIGDQEAALENQRNSLATSIELAREPDPTSQRDLAKSLVSTGRLTEENGDPTKAMLLYEQARTLTEGDLPAAGASVETKFILASVYNAIGKLIDRSGESAQALDFFNRAKTIRQQIVIDDPLNIEALQELGQSLDNIAYRYDRIGDLNKALEFYGEALTIQKKLADQKPLAIEFQVDLATTYHNIGSVLGRTIEKTKALESHGRAVSIQQKLTEDHPAVTRFQANLARSHNTIAVLLVKMDDPVKAQGHHNRALLIQRRLVENNPTVTLLQSELATTLNNMGTLSLRNGELARAADFFSESLSIQARLAQATPTDAQLLADLARGFNNTGALFYRINDLTKALASYGEGLVIQQRLAETNPTISQWQLDLATSHNNAGSLHIRSNDPVKALTSYTEALTIIRRLAEASPKVVEYQTREKDLRISIGIANDLAGRPREAVESLRRGIAMGQNQARNPTQLYNMAVYQSRLAGMASSKGSGLSAEEARAEADRAVEMLRGAVVAGYRNVQHIRNNKYLDPIRGRRDFQELLMDLGFPAQPIGR